MAKFGVKRTGINKFGHKAVTSLGFGVKRVSQLIRPIARKIDNTAQKVQGIAGAVAKKAAMAGVAAAAVGGPLGGALGAFSEGIAGVAGGIAAGATGVRGISNIANKISTQGVRAGEGLEKIGKGQYKEGFEQVNQAKGDALGAMFE